VSAKDRNLFETPEDVDSDDRKLLKQIRSNTQKLLNKKEFLEDHNNSSVREEFKSSTFILDSMLLQT